MDNYTSDTRNRAVLIMDFSFQPLNRGKKNNKRILELFQVVQILSSPGKMPLF